MWRTKRGLDDGWGLVLAWVVLDGRLECVGAELTSAMEQEPIDQEPIGETEAYPMDDWHGFKPIRAVPWRKLPIAGLIDEEREDLIGRLGEAVERDDLSATAKANARWLLDELDVGAGFPATPKGNEQFYLAVAVVYSEAYRRGQNPVVAVADRFDYARQTAAGYVQTARNTYGFLPPADPGKANGELTDVARRRLRKTMRVHETRE